ncbi:MAG TPA: GTP-binding protein [Planctomycetes bacterium]|nr:GTP-binding protein [Planctomycetota bacterium]
MRELVKQRVFGVAAHIDAGKTTVSERMLFLAGIQHREGRVDEGTATMDFEEEERERGITIHSAAIDLSWKDWDFTLVDTPGHVDFTIEVERCMRVLDGVVLVFDAACGVEAQTETVWEQATRHGVPKIGFLNKLDKIGVDFEAAIRSIESSFGVVALPLQIPFLIQGHRIKIADLRDRTVLSYTFDHAESQCVPEPWPEGETAEALEMERSSLLESLADADELFLADYLEDSEQGREAIDAAVRRCVLSGTVFPVLCGAALRGVGVECLLDAVGSFLPSPQDRPGCDALDAKGKKVPLALDPKQPLVARVFKVVASKHGPIAWLRVHQGKLEAHAQVWNSRSQRVERVHSLYRLEGGHLDRVEHCGPGRIVAMRGLQDLRTGDTISDRAKRLTLPPWTFPRPVISMAVEVRKSEEREELLQALESLEIEDPTMAFKNDEETGQVLLSGMGELHLQILASRLKREFHLDPLLGRPTVAHRESLRTPYLFEERIQRSYQAKTLDVLLRARFSPHPEEVLPVVVLDPGAFPEGSGPMKRVLEESVLGSLPRDLEAGLKYGYPLVHCRVELLRVEGEEEGSLPSQEDLETALSLMCRRVGEEAEVELLEPWMRVEVQVPEAHLSPILGDLQAHGGEVGGVEMRGTLALVRGRAPLGQLLDYSTRVRSLSQGRASATVFFESWRASRSQR